MKYCWRSSKTPLKLRNRDLSTLTERHEWGWKLKLKTAKCVSSYWKWAFELQRTPTTSRQTHPFLQTHCSFRPFPFWQSFSQRHRTGTTWTHTFISWRVTQSQGSVPYRKGSNSWTQRYKQTWRNLILCSIHLYLMSYIPFYYFVIISLFQRSTFNCIPFFVYQFIATIHF